MLKGYFCKVQKIFLKEKWKDKLRWREEEGCHITGSPTQLTQNKHNSMCIYHFTNCQNKLTYYWFDAMCNKVEYWFDLISQRFQFLILVWLWCFDGIASNVMLNGLRKLRHTSHAHKMIIIDTLPIIISYTYIKLIVSLCLWPFVPLSILARLVVISIYTLGVF